MSVDIRKALEYTGVERRTSGRGRHGNSKTKVPAEHILDMRYRREIKGEPVKDVVAAYPQYSREYVYHVLQHRIRCNLTVDHLLGEKHE